MSHRPASRLFNAFKPMFRQPLLRRRVQTAAAPEEASGFAKFWNSPVGPKTVHFWAPIMKWGLVLTGVSDFTRPADQLSLTQNLALTSTGAIWTRWCFIIRPKNMFLAAVNFFLFIVGSTQVARILMYQQSLKNAGEEIKAEGKELEGDLKAAEKKAEQVVKS
ncbi:UPF0041-domain-containing protein [Aaosphaeria arxii CBS 175.79]|uniref:Mitochondrial pyruvate carrier n=1 Tax=Aaosphaeria arxii CBS 175.79 TaxID=1450172 RepID=A0A6A5XWI7_9PLEO|nr:UPF0041-domain-containing protein [Aaosphaeria arxii CBS 175.79]KAF2017306.1 UPF0041-domain-containing protein [Aaosphaeria arxii CBS 175.79]